MLKLVAAVLLTLLFSGCIIIPNPSDCSQLPYEKQRNACHQDNAYIYAIRGQVFSGVSSCAQITDKDKRNRDQCYFDVASITKNVTVCGYISDIDLVEDCSVRVYNIVNCIYSDKSCQ
ncbi:MAG: hypothetical protein QW035_02310 [Candidatus Anstonellales archaeon]